MAPPPFVCIVDDDEAVRDSTCILLESHDMKAQAFASADAFLVAFDPVHTACIILDLHMPQMSGAELLDLLRARGVTTPIIVVSGRRDPVLDQQIRRAGVLAILSKPADDTELLALLRWRFRNPTRKALDPGLRLRVSCRRGETHNHLKGLCHEEICRGACVACVPADSRSLRAGAGRRRREGTVGQ